MKMKYFQPAVRFGVVTLVCAAISGCAFGTKMSFDKTSVSVPQSSGEVAVAVWDSRPYVLSGEKSPEWVGLQRSGFGIPYGVHTSSGAPLNREFSQAIVNSFNSAGVPARAIEIPSRMVNAQAVQGLIPPVGKSVLLEISQWRTDSMTNVNFAYDLKLRVYNNGAQVAEERVSGDEKLSGSFWNPIGASERVAVSKQKEKLDQLFGMSSVRTAMMSTSGKVGTRATASAATPVSASAPAPVVASEKASPKTTGSCSIEQVLSMKKAGLSDAQVRAACGGVG